MSTSPRPKGRPLKPVSPGHGANLRAARLAAGLTQAVLASRIGTQQTHVAKVERGKEDPTLEWLYRAAVAIGCKPCDLDPRLTHQLGDVMAPPPDENSPTVR